MKPVYRIVTLLVFASALSLAPGTGAVTVGQSDTFEDGTTLNWVVGVLGAPHPAPPQNMSSGGPAGADDNYLLASSFGGNGPGSRLSIVNLSQWAGDYVAAGVGAIAADVNNLGGTDLQLRLLFADPSAGPPSNVAISSTAVALPAASGWTTVVFPVAPSNLTAITGDVVTALTGATELRILHGALPAFPPDAIAAQLGIDNIRALSDPTPSDPSSWGAIKAIFR